MSIDTQEKLFSTICNASKLGTLGLFVGSGFSKALLRDDISNSAYTWKELLKKCCDDFSVSLNHAQGVSYPEYASQICDMISKKYNIKYLDAIKKLKEKIADLTTVQLKETVQKKYSTYLLDLKSQWIVTTNYDTVLEQLFGGRALSLSPNNNFIKINNITPIYHLHGVCNDPDSIVIVNEDYVELFRPNDYRQSRLPFLIKESTVLMLGYALGDFNVITAHDWAKNLYKTRNDDCNLSIIQLLHCQTTPKQPYTNDNGIVIVEFNDFETFFSDLSSFYSAYQKQYEKHASTIKRLNDFFIDSTENSVDLFIDDRKQREKICKKISTLDIEFGYIFNSYLIFLKKVFKKLNSKCSIYGAFDAYGNELNVLLDIMQNIPYKKMPAPFFLFLADIMKRLSPYIGTRTGQSYIANSIWNDRKHAISDDILAALIQYANSVAPYTSLWDLLCRLKSEKDNSTAASPRQ